MNIRKLMKEKVSRVSISSKMSIVMTVSIVLILTVFLGVNRYYNSFFVYQKLENASLTYLDSIDRMMENLVDTLDGYSRICFSNAGVQELLDKNSSGQVDFSLQDNVNNYLWELVVNVKQIKALFVLKRYDDAYAMIDALSRFYKINLSKGDDFITIEKNLVMLKSYIDIQQMRFGGEFEYIYSVDPEIMQWKILKFALQPLVENAINHGIHGFTTEGIINLDIVRTGEKSLKITLMDNGRGMSKEALKKAISGEEGRNGKSFGLFATLHRLQYCYGDRIWWSIESEENGGTTIIMKIEVEEC